MAHKHLNKDKNFSVDEIKSMLETMIILNLRYLAGIENLNSKDVINLEGFKLWSKSQESFHKVYILSISSDKDTDDNKLNIKIRDDDY